MILVRVVFSRSRGPDDPVSLTCADPEADVVERDDATEAFHHVADVDEQVQAVVEDRTPRLPGGVHVRRR